MSGHCTPSTKHFHANASCADPCCLSCHYIVAQRAAEAAEVEGWKTKIEEKDEHLRKATEVCLTLCYDWPLL